jgi:hypothetical protein
VSTQRLGKAQGKAFDLSHKSVLTFMIYQPYCKGKDRHIAVEALGIPGHTKFEDDSVFFKWRIRYAGVISWAAANAFDLGRHPERAKTHVFMIMLTARKCEKTKARNAYQLHEAFLAERALVQKTFPHYCQLLELQEKEYAAQNEKELMSPTFIHCHPWCRLTTSWWTGSELAAVKWDTNWKSVLRSVLDGKDEYDIIQGNPVRKGAFSHPTVSWFRIEN